MYVGHAFIFGEDDLLSGLRRALGERCLQTERQGGLAAAGQREVTAHQVIEELFREVVREDDGHIGVGDVPGQESAQRILVVQARLQPDAGAVAVPGRKAVFGVHRARGGKAARIFHGDLGCRQRVRRQRHRDAQRRHQHQPAAHPAVQSSPIRPDRNLTAVPARYRRFGNSPGSSVVHDHSNSSAPPCGQSCACRRLTRS